MASFYLAVSSPDETVGTPTTPRADNKQPDTMMLRYVPAPGKASQAIGVGTHLSCKTERGKSVMALSSAHSVSSVPTYKCRV